MHANHPFTEDGYPTYLYGTNNFSGYPTAFRAEVSPEEILKKVTGVVDAFVGDEEQFDDLTMMCLEYRGPRPAAG